MPDLPPLPLGPTGRHRESLWVGDSRYEYIDQDMLKVEWAEQKEQAQTSDKSSTKSFRRQLGPLDHFWFEVETGGKPLTDPVGSLEGLQVIWKLYEAEDSNSIADLRGLGLGTWQG